MTDLPPPGLARRLASMAYEGVLLFGVLFISFCLLYAVTQKHSDWLGPNAYVAFLFILLAIYFAWFWSHGGQTVAMKAWRLRVVDIDGHPLTEARALMRYLFSWLWFLPAMIGSWAAGIKDSRIYICIAAGLLAYALVALLHPRRQFLHDVICGTQLVTQEPVKR